MRFHATADDPVALLLQPLDPSSRRQSVRRGFTISLPILIAYFLLYLLNYVSWESKPEYKASIRYFWHYRRHEGFQNVASLVTYVTSQFTHDGFISMAIDSLVLIGVASILSSVFNRRTFFAVYVIGGFLAAAADCAWARFSNPCRRLTQAQVVQYNTSAILCKKASTKYQEILVSSKVFTMRGFRELLAHPWNFLTGYGEELERQYKLWRKYYDQTTDSDRWVMPTRAASGSLVCLCMLNDLSGRALNFPFMQADWTLVLTSLDVQ